MRLFAYGLVAAIAILAAGAAEAASGAAVYTQNCAACHNNLNPKIGDKAAWAPLISQGTGALVAAVVKGKGAMPPRGGHPNLSDADIQAAVEYIESKSR